MIVPTSIRQRCWPTWRIATHHVRRSPFQHRSLPGSLRVMGTRTRTRTFRSSARSPPTSPGHQSASSSINASPGRYTSTRHRSPTNQQSSRTNTTAGSPSTLRSATSKTPPSTRPSPATSTSSTFPAMQSSPRSAQPERCDPRSTTCSPGAPLSTARDLLSPEALELLLTPTTQPGEVDDDDSSVRYGLGTMLICPCDDGGPRLVGHDGSIIGGRTLLAADPHTGVVIVIHAERAGDRPPRPRHPRESTRSTHADPRLTGPSGNRPSRRVTSRWGCCRRGARG